MNHPDDMPIDIDEMRLWANAAREKFGLSWSEFAQGTGIAAGTLQPFCKGSYQGRNDRVARDIFRYKQTIEAKLDRAQGVPSDPGYFETPTSRRISTLLMIAQMGRITVAATGPGTGKTRTLRHYQACNANVWVATMRESTRSLNQMIWEVAKAIGQPLKYQYSAGASRLIADMVRGRGGVIVVDEANCLTVEAIEEIRAWHDETGVGICLLGNEELLMRIEGGRRRDQLARLNSRIAQRHIQNLPTDGDVVAFCDAWDVVDAGMRKMLATIALTPGAGGLRECQMIIEAGSMLAMDDGRPLSLGDLRDAQSTRITRNIRS